MTTRRQALCDQSVWDEIGDEDLFGPRRPVPQAVIDRANREWNAIPSDPAEIAVWMKLPPVGENTDA